MFPIRMADYLTSRPVLVRYLTQDDPTQSPRATELIERRLTEDNPEFISIVAMAETVWVPERAYGLSNV
jgi:predicted nucleic-acid-binding protein